MGPPEVIWPHWNCFSDPTIFTVILDKWSSGLLKVCPQLSIRSGKRLIFQAPQVPPSIPRHKNASQLSLLWCAECIFLRKIVIISCRIEDSRHVLILEALGNEATFRTTPASALSSSSLWTSRCLLLSRVFKSPVTAEECWHARKATSCCRSWESQSHLCQRNFFFFFSSPGSTHTL